VTSIFLFTPCTIARLKKEKTMSARENIQMIPAPLTATSHKIKQ